VEQTPALVAWAKGVVVSDAPNEARTEALRTLSGSADGLNAILDLAEQGSLPMELRTLASNLTNTASPPSANARRRGPPSPVTIRQRGLPPTDPVYIAIRERAARLLPPTSARRIPTSFELDLNYAGKVEDGRAVYEGPAVCAPCHALGSGPAKLGPDLSHIGSKYGKQAMLDAIVNPSEGIQFEYVPTIFVLKNGEQIAGQIAEERPDEIVVQIGPNQQQRIRPADVASRTETRVSLMPEGLLNNVTDQQIADLLEFLDSLK
jgi:putative heme-binding domain-containing protein